jgi:hypothetical protein
LIFSCKVKKFSQLKSAEKVLPSAFCIKHLTTKRTSKGHHKKTSQKNLKKCEKCTIALFKWDKFLSNTFSSYCCNNLFRFIQTCNFSCFFSDLTSWRATPTELAERWRANSFTCGQGRGSSLRLLSQMSVFSCWRLHARLSMFISADAPNDASFRRVSERSPLFFLSSSSPSSLSYPHCKSLLFSFRAIESSWKSAMKVKLLHIFGDELNSRSKHTFL